jgi:hypothetical protein
MACGKVLKIGSKRHGNGRGRQGGLGRPGLRRDGVLQEGVLKLAQRHARDAGERLEAAEARSRRGVLTGVIRF